MRVPMTLAAALVLGASPMLPAFAQADIPRVAQADGEVDVLRSQLRAEVPNLLPPDPERESALARLAFEQVVRAGEPFQRDVLMVVVDRNPRVEELSIVVARPDGRWEVLGTVKVSTGQPGRKGYYITPTGVFPNTPAILGYRAQGTFNENHIRGIGLKGSRVWDFGWQTATKGWRRDGETGEIRLQMHATDPVLESRFGRPASEGCVRIPSQVYRFLDKHGVIDAELEEASRADARFAALLPRDRVPSPLAGRAMVVVDSSVE